MISVLLLLYFISDFVCSQGSVKCKDNIQCVRSYDLCNTYDNCNDNSDEDEDFCKGKILQ